MAAAELAEWRKFGTPQQHLEHLAENTRKRLDAEDKLAALEQRADRADAALDSMKSSYSYDIGQCRLAADEATARHNKKTDEILDRAEKAESERDQAVKGLADERLKFANYVDDVKSFAPPAPAQDTDALADRDYGRRGASIGCIIGNHQHMEDKHGQFYQNQTVYEMACHIRDLKAELTSWRQLGGTVGEVKAEIHGLRDQNATLDKLGCRIAGQRNEAWAELARLRDGVEARVVYLSETPDDAVRCSNVASDLRSLLAPSQPASVPDELPAAKVDVGQVWRNDENGHELTVVESLTVGLRCKEHGYTTNWHADMRGHTLAGKGGEVGNG